MNDPRVTNAEFAVLDFLWESGEATKREIADQLYPAGGDSELATVHKLLQRLERKGLVQRDRRSTAHVFSAVPKSDFLGGELRRVASRLSGGSLVPLVMQLVEGQHLTKKERDELRALLDQQP